MKVIKLNAYGIKVHARTSPYDPPAAVSSELKDYSDTANPSYNAAIEAIHAMTLAAYIDGEIDVNSEAWCTILEQVIEPLFRKYAPKLTPVQEKDYGVAEQLAKVPAETWTSVDTSVEDDSLDNTLHTQTYRCVAEIDEDAASPEEAAQLANADFRDSQMGGLVFTVIGPGMKKPLQIDTSGQIGTREVDHLLEPDTLGWTSVPDDLDPDVDTSEVILSITYDFSTITFSIDSNHNGSFIGLSNIDTSTYLCSLYEWGSMSYGQMVNEFSNRMIPALTIQAQLIADTWIEQNKDMAYMMDAKRTWALAANNVAKMIASCMHNDYKSTRPPYAQ